MLNEFSETVINFTIFNLFLNRFDYLVEDIAFDSETKGQMVVYRRLYGDGSLWVRPLEMFLSEVDKNKYPNEKQQYRFELIEKESIAKNYK